MRNIAKRGRYPAIKLISKFKKFRPLSNFLLFSEPRGGSTWLSQIIHTIPNTAIIWEPINPRVYSELRRMKFGWRQYIPQDEIWREAEDFLLHVFAGQRLSYHTTSHLSLSTYLNAERLIIKFCRGNALLPWITNRFNLKYKPVYLVRHPFAVVSSQLRHGAWNGKLPKFEIPDSPFNEMFVEHEGFLKNISTLEERLVVGWCYANKYTLENPRNNRDWITVYYEELMRNPLYEIERIFSEWNVAIPNEICDTIKKPSETVKNNNFSADVDRQLSKWQRGFDKETLAKMARVLDYFQISFYQDNSIYPVKASSTNDFEPFEKDEQE